MTTKPETTFIGSVHRHIPKDAPYWMKNNNPYMGGIFDCWYSGSQADMWIEYKFIVVPARDTTMITPELSALQEEWGRGRLSENRNLAVVVGCKEGGVIFKDCEWEKPISTKEFKRRLIDRKQIAAFIISATQGKP